jgi:hypothetical protein
LEIEGHGRKRAEKTGKNGKYQAVSGYFRFATFPVAARRTEHMPNPEGLDVEERHSQHDAWLSHLKHWKKD